MSEPGSAGSGHPPGLWPVPGEGVLARHGNLVLLSSLDSGQLADTLLDLLEQVAAAGGDGREFADQVAAAVESDAVAGELADSSSVPSVLAFGVTGSGFAVTVSGGAWADITTGYGTQRIEPGQPGMLLRCLVRSSVSAVSGGLGPAASGPARTDRFSRLDAGTVRASGLSFHAGVPMTGGYVGSRPPAVQPPPPASPPVPPQPAVPSVQAAVPMPQPATPVDQTPSIPAQSMRAGPAGTELWQPPEPEREATIPPVQPVAEPFDSVLLGAAGGQAADLGGPPRAPLAKATDLPPGTSSYVADAPIVEGVYCKNNHFNDPQALFCAVCGISMNQQTLINRPGTRPPLGVLLLDDGSVFQLDRDYVVGREPGLDSSVANGQSRALRITDDSGIVSRVHAKVALDGWRVLVADLGSANGTRVRLPKDGGEQQLQPHVPVVLTAGSRVDLGGHGFTYESHRGR